VTPGGGSRLPCGTPRYRAGLFVRRPRRKDYEERGLSGSPMKYSLRAKAKQAGKKIKRGGRNGNLRKRRGIQSPRWGDLHHERLYQKRRRENTRKDSGEEECQPAQKRLFHYVLSEKGIKGKNCQKNVES